MKGDANGPTGGRWKAGRFQFRQGYAGTSAFSVRVVCARGLRRAGAESPRFALGAYRRWGRVARFCPRYAACRNGTQLVWIDAGAVAAVGWAHGVQGTSG